MLRERVFKLSHASKHDAITQCELPRVFVGRKLNGARNFFLSRRERLVILSC